MWKLNQERSRRIPWVARPYLCHNCKRALDDDVAVCSCGTGKPDDGWATVDDADDPWLGRALADHYVVTRKIGAGVFGTVYRAATFHGQEDYAIKLIDLSRIEFVDDDRALERIHREVRLLASIRSPHVVKFHDVLELPDSVVGIVTSYVDGDTLTDLVTRRGRLEIDRAAELGRQTAIGLSEVHRLGAVHRDIKPDNLLIQALGRGQEFVHVIDFGISLLEGAGDTDGFWGTPLYASPEQAMGEPLTPASDIYSLGTCLWVMLTGEPPFPGDNLPDVLDAHIHDPLPDLLDLRPELGDHPDMTTLLADMLAKSPDDRPASMSDVADRLTQTAWDYTPTDESASAWPTIDVNDSPLAAMTFDTDRPDRFPTSPFFDADLLPHLLLSISPRGLIARVHDATVIHTVKLDADSPFPEETTSPLPINAIWVGDADDGVMMTGHRDGTVRRQSPESRATTIYRDPRLAPITAVAEGERRCFRAAGSASGRIAVHFEPMNPAIAPDSLRVNEGLWQRLPSGKPVTALGIHDGTASAAVGRSHGEIEIFQYAHGTWERSHSLYANGTPVDIRFSDDAYLLAVTLQEGRRSVFSMNSGDQLQTRRLCRLRSAFSFSDRSPDPCCAECESLPETTAMDCTYLPPSGLK